MNHACFGGLQNHNEDYDGEDRVQYWLEEGHDCLEHVVKWPQELQESGLAVFMLHEDMGS